MLSTVPWWRWQGRWDADGEWCLGRFSTLSERMVGEPCSVLLLVLPQQEHQPHQICRAGGIKREGISFLSHGGKKAHCLTAQSYWRLIMKVKQPAAGNWAHKLALCLWKSLSQCFALSLLLKMYERMKCWCMVHTQGMWIARSLIGMKITLWWLRACQEKKKGKTLRRHEVLCSWKCLLPCKDSAVLFSPSLLLLKIFCCLIPTSFLILLSCVQAPPKESHTYFSALVNVQL